MQYQRYLMNKKSSGSSQVSNGGGKEVPMILKRSHSWSPRYQYSSNFSIKVNSDNAKVIPDTIQPAHHRCFSDGVPQVTDSEVMSRQAAIVGSWTTASLTSDSSLDDERRMRMESIQATTKENGRFRSDSESSSNSEISCSSSEVSFGNFAGISNAAIGLSESECDASCEDSGSEEDEGEDVVRSQGPHHQHKREHNQAMIAAANRLRNRVNSSQMRRSYLGRLGFEKDQRKHELASSKQTEKEPKNVIREARARMGPHARRASQASARARRAPKVSEPLKAPQKTGFKRSLVNAITHWIVGSDERLERDQSHLSSREELSDSNSVKSVSFKSNTEVFFVPTRKEISPQVKRQIWPTRQEFMTMVMRNMEEIEKEARMAAEVAAAAEADEGVFPCSPP